jgi:hypothetical protein
MFFLYSERRKQFDKKRLKQFSMFPRQTRRASEPNGRMLRRPAPKKEDMTLLFLFNWSNLKKLNASRRKKEVSEPACT